VKLENIPFKCILEEDNVYLIDLQKHGSDDI